MPRLVQKRRPAADRRVQVVAAARKLFARDGFDAASMRAVAAASGVSPAALYVYFPDKDALMIGVCDSIFADLIAEFRGAALGVRARDPFARLRAIMAAYVSWGLAHPDEYRLLFMMPKMHMAGHRGPPVPGTPQLGPALFDLLVSEIAPLVEAGHFRKADPAVLGETIWATGHGLIALLTTFAEFPFAPAPKLLSTMTDMVIRGLAAR